MNNMQDTVKQLELILADNIQKECYRRIMETLKSQFEKEMAPIVAKAVEGVSIDAVRAFHEVSSMRNELDLVINGVNIDERKTKITFDEAVILKRKQQQT